MTDTQTLLDKDVQIEELARRVEVLEEALRPFDAMAGELFAMNYNRTDVPFSLVGDDGVLRLSAGDFFDVRAALSTPSVGGSLACVPLPPTPEMFAAFQQGFQSQLSVRYKARFKSNPSAAEQMSAEEAGLRAMLAAPSRKDTK